MDEGARVDPQEHHKSDYEMENNSSKVLQEDSVYNLKMEQKEDGQVITESVSISRENSLTSLLAVSDNEEEDSIDFTAEKSSLLKKNDSKN